MQAKLIFLNGSTPYAEVVVTQSPFVIGRRKECHLTLDSQSVSRQHCEIKLKSIGFTVKDLKSRNGTLLNGHLLPTEKRVKFNDGDVLQIGKFLFKCQVKSELLTAQETKAKQLGKRHEGLTKPSAQVASNPTTETIAQLEDIEVEGWEVETLTDPTQSPSHEAESQSDREDSTRRIESSDTQTNLRTQAHSDPSTSGEASEAELDEHRREAIRKRLKGPPAKDSQDAAAQALKRMFGRQS